MQAITKINIDTTQFPFIWDRINDFVVFFDQLLKRGSLDLLTYTFLVEKLYSIRDYLQYLEQLSKLSDRKGVDIDELPEEDFLHIAEKYFL